MKCVKAKHLNVSVISHKWQQYLLSLTPTHSWAEYEPCILCFHQFIFLLLGFNPAHCSKKTQEQDWDAVTLCAGSSTHPLRKRRTTPRKSLSTCVSLKSLRKGYQSNLNRTGQCSEFRWYVTWTQPCSWWQICTFI